MVLAGLAYATYLYAPLATRLYPFNLALALGELVRVLWLLTAGVDPEKWRARHALAEQPSEAGPLLAFTRPVS